MNPRLIVIDGKTYTSVNDMPAYIRARYQQALRTLKDHDGNRIPDALEGNKLLSDANGDGIPDILENTAGEPLIKKSMRVLVDGQEYNSLDDLPADVRIKYDQAMGTLDTNHNGIPDFMEGLVNAQSGASHVMDSHTYHTLHHSPRKSMPVTPVITPDTSNGWLLILLGAVLLFLCAGFMAGAWYFFLR